MAVINKYCWVMEKKITPDSNKNLVFVIGMSLHLTETE